MVKRASWMKESIQISTCALQASTRFVCLYQDRNGESVSLLSFNNQKSTYQTTQCQVELDMCVSVNSTYSRAYFGYVQLGHGPCTMNRIQMAPRTQQQSYQLQALFQSCKCVNIWYALMALDVMLMRCRIDYFENTQSDEL